MLWPYRDWSIRAWIIVRLSLSLSLSLMETLALVIAFPPLAWWSCCVLYLCMVRRLSEVVLSFTVSIYNFVWIHFICVQMEVWLWARFESCFPSPFPNFLRPWSFLIPFLPSLQLLFSLETRTSHAHSQKAEIKRKFPKERFKTLGDGRWFKILSNGAIPPPSHQILLTYAHLHSPHPIFLASPNSYYSECEWIVRWERGKKGKRRNFFFKDCFFLRVKLIEVRLRSPIIVILSPFLLSFFLRLWNQGACF